MQIVTTWQDAAIDNTKINIVAHVARNENVLGERTVGFCYLKGELTHNWLNELSSTGSQPFWWHDSLTDDIVSFLNDGHHFPLQHQPNNVWMPSYDPSSVMGAMALDALRGVGKYDKLCKLDE